VTFALREAKKGNFPKYSKLVTIMVEMDSEKNFSEKGAEGNL
jgi:hypothetical protein